MDTSVVIIPDPEDSGTIWLAMLSVQEGQSVHIGQALARLESHNSVFELICHQDGYVVGLHARSGQIVHPGQILCYICGQPSIPAITTGSLKGQTGVVALDPSAIIIFGGGGHGKTVIDLIRSLGTYRIVGVIDDGLPPGSEVLGVPVLGGEKNLAEWIARGVHLAVNAVGGIGNPTVRIQVFEKMEKAGFSFPILVHPSAVVERSATLEPGVQVFAHTYIGSAARVGFGSVINVGAIVHHDCVLGRVVNLSPGATLAGNVHVGNYAQIGMLATVNLKISVGENARLGNGCTVKGDVPDGGRVWAGATWPIRELSIPE